MATEARWSSKINLYSGFVKLEHTLFTLPLLFAGALLALGRWPDGRLTLLIILAAVGARTAAMSLNRIIDRAIDAKNPRTAIRHLPSGKMKVSEAWVITGAGVALYLIAAWLISPLTLPFAPIPLAVFVLYPYGKRFTQWCHLGVGLGMSMAPLGAWFACKLSFQDVVPALFLGGFTILWGAGFDIIYATLDIESDRRTGIRSLPANWGEQKARSAAAVLHFLAFACLAAILLHLPNKMPAMLVLGLGILDVMIFEHLTRNVNLAFFWLNTIIGALVLLMIWVGLAA